MFNNPYKHFLKIIYIKRCVEKKIMLSGDKMI